MGALVVHQGLPIIISRNFVAPIRCFRIKILNTLGSEPYKSSIFIKAKCFILNFIGSVCCHLRVIYPFIFVSRLIKIQNRATRLLQTTSQGFLFSYIKTVWTVNKGWFAVGGNN